MDDGWYLLYDDGCRKCTFLADRIEEISAGRLRIASLRSADVQNILSDVRLDWRFEPTVLVIRGASTRAVTGLRLRMWLLARLGVVRSARVAREAHRLGIPAVGIGPLGLRRRPISDESLANLDSGTRVQRMPGLTPTLELQPERVVISLGRKTVSFPVVVAAEVKFLTTTREAAFTCGDIPGELDEPGRLLLVRTLLKEGFLALSAPPA